MAIDPKTIPYVEIGLLDGSVRSGRLPSFAPTMMDLIFDGERGRTSLAAEQIAYIAFHPCKAKPYVAPPGPLERLLIHVGGGKVFAVEVSPQSIASNLGFRGRPTAEGSPFHSIFFYKHGVNAHEKDIR